MMTGEAQSEVVLQLLSVVEPGATNIFPAREDAKEPIRSSAHLD
jgi:hypothetical protein